MDEEKRNCVFLLEEKIDDCKSDIFTVRLPVAQLYDPTQVVDIKVIAYVRIL